MPRESLYVHFSVLSVDLCDFGHPLLRTLFVSQQEYLLDVLLLTDTGSDNPLRCQTTEDVVFCSVFHLVVLGGIVFLRWLLSPGRLILDLPLRLILISSGMIFLVVIVLPVGFPIPVTGLIAV